MQIQVTQEFAGRKTQERRIYKGEYDLDDPALFDLGQYLLDNGFAVEVGAKSKELVPAAPIEVVDTVEFKDRVIERLTPETPPADYEAMSIRQLREVLDARGVPHSNLRYKDEILKLVKESNP